MENFLLNSKYLIYFLIALITLVIFFVLYKKYKLTKYQLLVFAVMVIFWSAIIITRSYSKIYMIADASTGGLGLDELLAVSVVSIYGFISIFVRLPIFILSDFFKSRKFFIILSLIFIAISSFIVYINPKYITLLTASLAIGV